MARSIITPRARRQRALQQVTTPAPYKGMNSADPQSVMDDAYAISINNFVATPKGLSLRKGYKAWATGLTASVTTLMPYHTSGFGTSKLFAVAGGNIFDVTSTGAVGAPVVSGLSTTSTYWQFATQNYTTGNVHHMIAVNGVDMPRLFDGTTWTTASSVATPAAVGQFRTLDNNGNNVNLSSLVDVTLHQQRLWFVKDNSTQAYYCDIGQVGGVLNQFDFGPSFPRGGKLLKLASWSADAGGDSGMQTMLVALSDRGDAVIYLGNDPAQASTWARKDTYALGTPVGRRCTQPLQGDLLILTQDGLFPMSSYAQSSRTVPTAALSYAISRLITEAATSSTNLSGFEMVVVPGENVLLLNIPQTSQSSNFQYCYNLITKGWSKFTGWPAQTFAMFKDTMYFGGVGTVHVGFSGYADAADTSGNNGSNITANSLTAFTAMEMLGSQKHAKLVKPYITTAAANAAIRVGVNTDFDLSPVVGSSTAAVKSSTVWDGAIWDSPSATWVGSLSTYNQWITPQCYPGEYLALYLTLSAVAEANWTSTGWMVEAGQQFG